MENGAKRVQYFINEILLKNEFKKEDMKTRNFVIKKEI